MAKVDIDIVHHSMPDDCVLCTEIHNQLALAEAVVEAASAVVRSWGPVEHGQTTFTDLLVALRVEVQRYEKRQSDV